MGEHVAGIADQGKAVGNNPPDNLHDKDTACYSARQDESFSFMRPVLMFMAVLVFDMIIVYAVDVFDGFSPVKLSLRLLLPQRHKGTKKNLGDLVAILNFLNDKL
ncbi:MAG TPA: hypothetical protein ACFYEK_11520 [Candidatus Wunengus sp. YC60]|uniref:hypothetical protein n=1 Tax=Candidatus Wunengus sp. YC60 TaxID=3367697 RepID=UPI0040269A20